MSLIHLYYYPAASSDRLFEDAPAARSCPRGTCAPSTVATPRRYRPSLDLHESKDTNTVTATLNLPGLTSEDVAIDVHQNRLTVSGESASSDAREGRRYVVHERRAGKFSRTLQLPFGTTAEDVKAKMENGVLTITFPKTSQQQHAERIVVH